MGGIIWFIIGIVGMIAGVFVSYTDRKRRIELTHQFMQQQQGNTKQQQEQAWQEQARWQQEQARQEQARWQQEQARQEQARQQQENSQLAESAKILGVSVHATIDEINRAYRLKMKEFHPDRNVNVTDAVREMIHQEAIKINAARDYLLKQKS